VKILSRVLCIAFLFPAPGFSAMEEQEGAGLNLAAIAAEAKTNNPSLGAARRRLSLLEAEIEVNSAFPNPTLEIDQAVSPGSDGYEAKLAQPVPLTRRAGTARAAAQARYEAARKELEALESRILSSVRKAWYSLRIARERRNFEETNVKFSMDLLNKIEMRLQTGEAGNSDLARAKVETTRSGYRLQEAETGINAAANAPTTNS